MAEVPELTKEYIDVTRGATHRHRIGVGDISSSLKARIEAVDLTVHELMEQIIIQEKMSNLHLMQISSENITEDDIDWP